MRHPVRRAAAWGTRPGTAIVAALAIVAMAGALLAAAAAASSAGAHAAYGERASLVVQGEARRALAEALAGWEPADDSLAVGAGRERALALPAIAETGVPLAGRLRVQRLAPTLYALSVEVRVASVGGGAPPVRRRLRLLVERVGAADPALGGAPARPISRWSAADLY